MLTVFMSLLIVGVVSLALARLIENHNIEEIRHHNHVNTMLVYQALSGEETYADLFYNPRSDELVALTGGGRIITSYGERYTEITKDHLKRAGFEPVGEL